MKTILIKFLFWLLKVDLKTKNIVPFDDLRIIAGDQRANQLAGELRKERYRKALATAYSINYLQEWLYLQVVTKRNEHIKTIDEEKKKAQLSAILTFLRIIEEMRIAHTEIRNIDKLKRK